MMDDRDYERVRRSVEADLRAEKERRGRFLFQLHATAYGMAMIIVWLVIRPSFGQIFGPDSYDATFFALALLSVMGAAQVGFHWVAYRLNNSDAERVLRDRIAGAVLRIVGDQHDKEKAKRHLHTDDEEVEPNDVWLLEESRRYRSDER